MLKLFFLFSFLTFFLSAQPLTGVVQDTLAQPLESANVIARPLTHGAALKFAIADHKGRYKLDIDRQVAYEIRVSYIGYKESILELPAGSTLTSHDFVLASTGIELKEVIIDYKYEPIVVKKDTLIYDVKAFTTGNERKLKEQLEKLPGVEVDKDGGVTVQGKRVTHFMVENKSFFGGGTKLGVENIPADAVDKVEVIDHFNEVGFLKEVSGSDELAMNIKLKEDKKKFIFGDIESGGGNNNFYQSHAALFYYTPKTNFSFIGDVNNTGKNVFSFEDLMRFGGGISKFINNSRPSFTNLYAFANENKDVVANRTRFAALNFSHDFSNKLEISGYAIFSKLFNENATQTDIQYLQTQVNEQRDFTAQNRDVLALANVKFTYSPNKKERWYHNAQYQSSNNHFRSTLQSWVDTNANTFETLRKADHHSFKQFAEWHKQYNKNHSSTWVINHQYQEHVPENEWLTDQPFLAGFIPIIEDDSYQIHQIKKAQSHTADMLFKHYWIVNAFHHIYTHIGNNWGTSSLQTSEFQTLSNGSINDFASQNFGNQADYLLNDAFVGVEYKFKIGKWINKPALFLHHYYLQTKQIAQNYELSQTLFQPQFESEYEFNNSESLRGTYRLTNQFPQINVLAERFTLQSFNTVFRGNALLRNERFHNATLNYNKMDMYRGTMLFANLQYNRKVRTIRNTVVLEGINQFTTPEFTHNPETQVSFMSNISQKVYRFQFRLNTSVSWFEFLQEVNGIENLNHRSNQQIGLEARTAYRKWPSVKLGYTRGFSQFRGVTRSDFQSQQWTASFDYTFFKTLTFKTSYDGFENTNTNNQNTRFDITTAEILYQKEKSPFTFQFSVYNLLNTQFKNNNSFTDFLITEQTTFILPRIMMFTLRYKI